MPRKRPDPELVALLSEWLASARAGRLRGVFLVGLVDDGTYLEDYLVHDLEDMLVEVRGAWIRGGRALVREPH